MNGSNRELDGKRGGVLHLQKPECEQRTDTMEEQCVSVECTPPGGSSHEDGGNATDSTNPQSFPCTLRRRTLTIGRMKTTNENGVEERPVQHSPSDAQQFDVPVQYLLPVHRVSVFSLSMTPHTR